jgi:hypothetical protein
MTTMPGPGERRCAEVDGVRKRPGALVESQPRSPSSNTSCQMPLSRRKNAFIDVDTNSSIWRVNQCSACFSSITF